MLHITDQREREPLEDRRRRGRRKERTDTTSHRTKSRYFFLKAPLRGEGCDGALLTCEVPVELMTPNRSNKLVEDSAGRLRPTAAARMNGNSLASLTSGVAKRLAAVEHQRAGGPAADMEDAP